MPFYVCMYKKGIYYKNDFVWPQLHVGAQQLIGTVIQTVKMTFANVIFEIFRIQTQLLSKTPLM